MADDQGLKPDADNIKALQAEREKILDDVFKRNVGVYGAINLRTDGKDAVIAFRKEKAPPSRGWFYYELQRNQETGAFIPVLDR